jgi:nicotinamidase-related amidase
MQTQPAIPSNAALVLIDVQQGFDRQAYWGGGRNNPDAEARVAELLAAWRAGGRPVIHVRHASTGAASPLRPGQPGHEFKPEAAPLPGEPVVTKHVNSAFIGTTLELDLWARGITTLVLAGLTTDHCVSTTARMAGNLRFTTYVVSDATATFDRVGPDGVRYDAALVHAVSLASLHGEFATVATAAEVLERAGVTAGAAA